MAPCEVHVVPRADAHAAQLASLLWSYFQRRHGPRATECTLSAAGTLSKAEVWSPLTHEKYIISLGGVIMQSSLVLELRALYFYATQKNRCKVQVTVAIIKQTHLTFG